MHDGLQPTVLGLIDAVPNLERSALAQQEIREIVARGYLRPAEDEKLIHWFARYLTQREALWSVINEIDASIDVPLRELHGIDHWRAFLLGYAAACMLVRQDRFLLTTLATSTLIQRKLNEGSTLYRIPRKQFSAIFSGYTDPVTALQLYEAMRVVKIRRRQIARLTDDPIVGPIVSNLPQLEAYLDPSKRSYLKGLVRYLVHRWRRRGASAKQQTVFAVLEGFGRTASLINPGAQKRVTPEIRGQADALLLPGDVIISRHRYALTNYLLPGSWPHASLFIGTPQQRIDLGIDVDAGIAARWVETKCTLEALRDGVLFRPLSETLDVDYFAVIRPKLTLAEIVEGIERVVKHEGKSYNFDFDFFTSDKLVCTEVVYRAFDGIGGIDLPLTERAGRKTLSAEDLLDLALSNDGFSPVAIFGFPSCKEQLISGTDARAVLKDSYRQGPHYRTASPQDP